MTRTVPTGVIGKYYATRHAYGHYRSCGVTGTYLLSKEVIDKTPEYLTQLLKYALYHTIQKTPALCYGVVEATQDEEANFTILEAINWDDAVEMQTLSVPKEKQDVTLSRLLGEAHEYLFKDQDRKPAWKVTILRHASEPLDKTVRVDVLFINHHAIGDGTSSAAFHKAFAGFLQQYVSQPDLQVNWPCKVPSNLPPIPYLEKVYPLPHTSHDIPAAANKITTKPQLDVWAATPPTFSFETYTSRVQTVSIPSFAVSNILAECRRLRTTLTGLLHGLMVLHLSKSVPQAQGFRAVTPYSMRRFTGVSDDEMLNHVSFISSEWDEDITLLARNAAENSTQETGVIAKITQQYQAEITDELAAVPIRGPQILIDLLQIADFDQFCQTKMKNKRVCTYEISNVGALKIPESPVGSEGLVELEKLTFTQSAMVDGPALGCSVISIRGKSLVVGLSWQEGILEDAFVDGLAAYLERRLRAFGETA